RREARKVVGAARSHRMSVWLAALILVLGAAAAGAAKTEIVYMNWYTGDADTLESQIIELFNAEHPDTQVTKLAVEWGVYMDPLFTMIAAGTPPDIVVFDPADTANMIVQGVLQPLDGFVERDGFDLSIFRRGFLEEG